ncbi:hypothetical protein ACFLQG_01585 [Candidatus Zixiibacteriota bacterium]
MVISEKQIQSLFIFIGIIICGYLFYIHREFYNDDAFISLRYANNLINGHGLVWNIGQRVEGYTNFLHIILTSAVGLTGVDLITSSRIVNGLAFLFMNIIVILFLRRMLKKQTGQWQLSAATIIIVLLMNISPMISWIYGGLEGPLFASLVTIGVVYFLISMYENKNRGSLILCSLFFVLSGLARPDGLLFWMGSFLYLIIYLRLNRAPVLSKIVYFLIPLIIIYVPYFIWRYNYYGELLPLTYYLKATGFTLGKAWKGITYIYSYLIAPPFIFIFLLIMIPYFLFKRRFDIKLLYLLSMITLYLLYIIYIGGDYMHSFRHLLPLIPISLILLYMLISPFIKKMSSFKLVIMYIFVLMLILMQLLWRGTSIRPMQSEDYVATEVGKYINDNWPQSSVIALNTAGATPYYAPNHTFIDMLGMNDPHIAKREIDEITVPMQKIPGHFKGDGDYVLSLEPEYIILGPARGTIIEQPWFLSDFEMAYDSRFYDNYVVRVVELYYCDFIYYERVK